MCKVWEICLATINLELREINLITINFEVRRNDPNNNYRTLPVYLKTNFFYILSTENMDDHTS